MSRQVCNPYLPSWEYVPDGEPHVFGDRVYIFGSHDKFGGTSYCENDYVCWSAPVHDLTDWRKEGTIYTRAQDPTPIKPCQNHMWAPDVCCGADGRYYLYYALEWLNRIGVAVCDTPAGKYEFYGEVRYKDGVRYGGRGIEPIRFDPAVLFHNNRTYLYTGFSCTDNFWINLTAKHMKSKIADLGNEVAVLADDMLTVIEGPKPLLPGKRNSKGTGFEGHEFYEASSMRCFDGKFYAVYSSVLSHELCYALSDYPDRDFRYGGVLHSNGNIFSNRKPSYYWGNNHGSLERIEDRYYIFGHRQTNRNEANRQGIAEPITFRNGKFGFSEMTSQGLNGKPLLCEGDYEAGIACVLYAKKGACKTTGDKKHPYITQTGEDREENPGQFIANMRDGSVCGFKYFDIPKDRFILTLKTIGNAKAQGRLCLSVTEDFTNSADFSVVKGENIISKTVSLPAGKQPLYFQYKGKGAIDFISLSFDRIE